MLTIFHIIRFSLLCVIVITGLYLGYGLYGLKGMILSIIPSILLGLIITNITQIIEHEITLYIVSKKTLTELEDYVKNGGIGLRFLGLTELKKRNADLEQFRYVIDEMLLSQNQNEQTAGKELKSRFYD